MVAMTFQVPRYWARAQREVETRLGGTLLLTKYGWSNSSVDEAELRAARMLDELVARVMAAETLDSYSYGTRAPMREELIQEISHGTNVVAFVTRNSYGALVINSARAMFADIDCPKPKPSGSLLKRLFGGTGPAPSDPAQEALERIAAWSRRHPEYSVRVYRTNAGLRVLFTSHAFEPADPSSGRILEELGSDPLYVRLCKAQKCFRARLTPKPWRIGMQVERHTWPAADAHHEAAMARWVKAYDGRRERFAVCCLQTQFGSGDVLDEIGPVLRVHDEVCRVGQSLPLA
ncbi:MAG: hypothetical protein N2Z21_09655 [Candidatus Sumerlaeaceae bacterium]|nr:hypothetical protein [Candidatus Sumerlaeaceae bacterium]